MVFNFVLKNIFKANTEEEKLRASILYGWCLVLVGFISFMIVYLGLPIDSSSIFLITLALFIFRYTSVKPLLGATAGGITVIATASIFDSLFRRDNALGMGAFFGVIMVLIVMLIKNIIVAWYYLIRETFRYYQYKKQAKPLEETILTNA